MIRCRVAVLVVLFALLFAACGGDSGDEAGNGGTNGGSGQVEVGASNDDDAGEELTIDDLEGDLAVGGTPDDEAGAAGGDTTSDEEAAADDGGELTLEELEGGEGSEEQDEDRIEVAGAEEDPLDGLLNAFTVFRTCLEEDGFEFNGAPGQDGAVVEDFEPGYIQALQKCATSSDILTALEGFGAAQAALTPEEIAENNFGLPAFKECMEDLGWEVADLVPDERGALAFGQNGQGLTPPDGTDFLDTGALNQCRAEAEQYVTENYVPEEEG